MASLQVRIEGQIGSISLSSFVNATGSALKVLQDLDFAISRQAEGSLFWYVTGLTVGSLAVQLDSRSRFIERNYDNEIVDAFLGAMKAIETQEGTPPYLSELGMRYARRFVKVIGSDGATGITVAGLNQTVNVTGGAVANITALTRVKRRSIGSVEGRLETITVHGGKPRFIAYHSRTHKAVTCRIDGDDLLAEAVEALGRRVRAFGTVHTNLKGDPLRVEVGEIHVLRNEDELPTRDQVRGSDPSLTGSMTTEEFIRSIRGG